MFKNRSIQMKLVKDEEAPLFSDYSVNKLTATAKDVTQELTKAVAVGVGTYILADTIRKIAIHIVVTKVA